jgi:hypothetical protein
VANHSEALDILIRVRRSLTSQLADAIVREKRVLLENANSVGNPFSRNHALEEMISRLGRLNAAIFALKAAGGAVTAARTEARPTAAGTQIPPTRDAVFARFIALVAEGHLEEATQELARVLRMPHDRMTTATRFFDRAVRSDPSIAAQLIDLPAHLENASSAQCMSLLVKTFGFQAVETRLAVAALRGSPTPHPTPAHAVGRG